MVRREEAKSESMKNARMEVAAMKKRGDFGRQEKRRSADLPDDIFGWYFSVSRTRRVSRVRQRNRTIDGSAAKRIAGQHQSADFNDARRHVREHRMNGSSGSHRNNNLVHVDNAEVMRLREVKRQPAMTISTNGAKCEFDTSNVSPKHQRYERRVQRILPRRVETNREDTFVGRREI